MTETQLLSAPTAQNFEIVEMENIEAPMSNDFWTGAAAGAGTVLAVAGLAVAMGLLC